MKKYWLLAIGLLICFTGVIVSKNPDLSSCGTDCIAQEVATFLMGSIVFLVGLIISIVGIVKLVKGKKK